MAFGAGIRASVRRVHYFPCETVRVVSEEFRIAQYLLGQGVGARDRVAHLDRNHPAAAEVAEQLSPDRAVTFDGADDCPDDDPREDGDFDAVVLQLYTSGTTGRPK